MTNLQRKSIFTSVANARFAMLIRVANNDDWKRCAERETVQELPKYEKAPKRKYTVGKVWGLVSSIMP